MADPKELHPGDPCPACGGELVAAPVPTADQRAAADDKERRDPLPAYADTATEKQRAELGALHRCARCGYQTRFPLEKADAPAEPESAGGETPTRRGSRATPGAAPR